MTDEKRLIKGGLRATLALIISIVALIFAIIAFNRTGGQANRNAQMKDLQAKMERMKKETSERVDKIREETAKALEKIGKAIRKEEAKP
ncbi:MAG: hypothetical protein GTO24_12560 [candidate division Zixibacteria bacterium]|nr:hypothetical protein [candidate division Zixibacteria bacterium]